MQKDFLDDYLQDTKRPPVAHKVSHSSFPRRPPNRKRTKKPREGTRVSWAGDDSNLSRRDHRTTRASAAPSSTVS